MKNMIRTGVTLLSLFTALNGKTYYVAVNDVNGNNGTSAAPFTTFAKAFSAMSGGDTLIIKDGTYTERMTGMPSGVDGKYITIKAEHNFKVKVRVGGPLFMNGNSYVRIEGIKYDGALSNSDCAIIASSHHIKIIRCSFTGSMASSENWNIVTFGITAGCSYILVEECWAWGTGRYKFLTYTSNNVIFRRCVARHDYHPSVQCACFHRYSSTNAEFQNCIALDCGLPNGTNGNFYGGFFNDNHDPAVENTGKNLGCILLNLGAGCPIYDIRIWGTRTIENCVIWNCINGMDISNFNDGVTPFSPANAYVNHCTIGNLSGSGWAGGWGIFDEIGTMGITSVRNSIITNTSDALNAIQSADYNCFYGDSTNYSNTPAGSYDNTNNPELLYITRAAAAAGNASDSGFRGASVEKRYGADGSLWGDDGYEALTNEYLWPWPNENEIKADMSSWDERLNDNDYTSAGVLGSRGFCAKGNGINGMPLTLTSYIWEYLGHPCPPEIYGSAKTRVAAVHMGEFFLECSPNPTGTVAAVTFESPAPSLLHSGSLNRVKLSVFTVAGRHVATLADGPQSAGRHTFIWRVDGSSPGVYLVRLQAGSGVKQLKLMVTR
jgi:hypothetical protein